MRKIKKRIVAIMMVLLTLIVNIPISTERVEAMTISEYNTKVAEFISDSRWRNGVSWGDISPQLSTYPNSSGCCAYAADFVRYVYGSNDLRSGTQYYSIDEVRKGDVVYISGHWLVVLDRNDNLLYTAEGNYGDSNNKQVRIKQNGYVISNNIFYVLGNDGNWYNGKSFQYGYHYDTIGGSSSIVQNSNKFTNTKVEYVTDTTAKICTDVSQATYPECGFYFGTSGELSSMKKVSEGPTVTNAKYNSYRLGEIYTDTNSYKWWNPLTPGTKYYYAFYVTSGNTTYVSTIQSFTTTGNSNVDKIAPVISDVSVKADVAGYTITCTVTDNVGVTKVTFPSWTDEGGTDDVITPWPEGVNTGSTYTYRVNDSEHNYVRGKYSTDIYAYDAAGNESIYHIKSVDVNNTYKYVTGVKCGNSMYYLYDDVLSWDEAKAKCESMGGHLAVVTSEDEQNAISFLIESGSVHRPAYYLGGTVNNSTISWVTGESASYTNWTTGEPDNANGNENRLEIYTSNGKWNDCVASIHDTGFICEVEYPIILNVSDLRLNVSEQKNIQLTNTESDLDVTDVSWSSSDSSVATVSDTGLIRALKPGSSTITVKYGSEVATCKVTVNGAALSSNKLAPPDGLKWDNGIPGKVIFNGVPYGEDENGYHYYRINILKDNQYEDYILMSTSQKGNVITNDAVMHHIEDCGEGSYTFQVCAVSKNNEYVDSDYSAISYIFSYKIPSMQLNAPKNIRLDGTVLKWDAVENAGRYEIQIYVGGEYKTRYLPSSTSRDMASYIERFGNGVYIFKVSARSGNISEYRSSEFASSAEYFIGEQKPNESPADKLTAPTGLQWNTEHFGTITWTPVEGAASYVTNLYCDGKQVVQYEGKPCKADFSIHMLNDGEYVVELYAVSADSSKIESSDIVRSGSLEYKAPQQKVSVPANIYWQGTVLNWDTVKDASSYEIACFVNGQRKVWSYYVRTSYDVKRYLDQFGNDECIFKIRALSGDITKYGHSEYATAPEYDMGGTPEHPDEGQEEQVRNFVKRLYQVILNREAEEDGLNAWTKQLLAGKATGAQLVAGFVESDEFTQRGLSNEEVVEIMYQAMLGRASDEGGKAGWSKILNNGCSYLNIVNGFSGSAEFNEICGNYGITAGTVELNRQRDKNPQLTAFVARCYTQALGRQYEINGLEAWCDAIISGRNTPKQVAQNFIFSDEFTQKNLNEEQYVKVLYRTFMGREADEAGLDAWVNVLESGREDRAKVLEGFSDSAEFAEILQSFGLR